MFWKRKSEAGSAPRAEAARAMSLDQARPVPILKPAVVVPPAPEAVVGSAGSIRFAGSPTQCGSPASSDRSRSISPQRSPLHLQGGQPLYQPNSPSQRPVQQRSVSTPVYPAQGPSHSPAHVARHPHPPSPTHPAMHRVQTQSSRRSSRPASPTTTSFGARVPYAYGSMAMPLAQPTPARGATPLTTPPLGSASHITTPPTAYCSAGQSRAAPPPSPYRRVAERQPLEPLPARSNSLFDTPSAPSRLAADTPKGGVPMLNIIPATPQAMGEEWGMNDEPVRRDLSDVVAGMERVELEGAFTEQVEVMPPTASVSAPIITITEPAQGVKRLGSLPALDELEFSPFEGRMVLPKSSSIDSLPSPPANLAALPHGTPDTIRLASPPLVQGTPTAISRTEASAPNQPLPSPPFESYGSLPSLDSERSMPSSTSSSSLRSSSSSSSLNSYPDVEEALGSMLASLSDPSMPLPSINSFSKRSNSADSPSRSRSASRNDNAGLGLGLALHDDTAISLGGMTTAPLALSPRRKAPPAPLDLSFTNNATDIAPVQHSAPPRINHRIAFYSSAKAAPNSPHSGVFTQLPRSASGSVQGTTEFVSSPNPAMGTYPSGFGPTRTWSQTSLSTEDTELSYARGMRDSVSLTSEASDDDLHTASIVCLTPVVQREYDYAEERVQGYVAEVGVAL